MNNFVKQLHSIMFNFHLNRYEYFKTQIINTEEYVIPFVEKYFGPLDSNTRVLEIGSAEGGVLKAFLKKGCIGTGVEQDKLRIEQCTEFLAEDIVKGRVTLYHNNILDPALAMAFTAKFDIIVLKDVIEHITEKELLLQQLKKYLRSNGAIYFGFPPWRMPFGGHQQICENKFLSRLPWFHLLPRRWYESVLKQSGEHYPTLMEIRDTGISIKRFERLIKTTGYRIEGSKHYLINPIYKYKFNFKPVEQFKFISKLTHFKDFFTTCAYYYVVTKNPNQLPDSVTPGVVDAALNN